MKGCSYEGRVIDLHLLEFIGRWFSHLLDDYEQARYSRL